MMLFMHVSAVAQAPETPQFDPSDVYFQAYLEVRVAEQLEKDGDVVGALEKYGKAEKLFKAIGKYYPDWKTGMVQNRADLTMKAMGLVREKAGEQIKKDKGVIAELEGGERTGGNPIDPSRGVVPLTKGILEVEPLQARRLKDAEAEVARLKEMVAGADARSNKAMRNAAKVGDLERKNQALSAKLREAAKAEDVAKQNDALAAKLRAAETDVQSLRARMAAAPVAGEMKSLNDRIERLEQEREAMGMALRASRGDHTEALAMIEILNADMEIMKGQATALRQKEANLDRDLKTERKVANEVVAGQRRQMQALEKALETKSTELKAAQGQISGLQQELEESHAAFAELKKERDGLLVERDHMAALLKLNEGGRIEQLIEQNMGLAKSLREASERVERLNLDNNSAKDQIVDALRDLAIAKSQINRLHQETKEQDKRLADLTEKLKNEEDSLASGEVEADPAEVEMLREVIRRQLRVQERRRQAKELLIDAARQLGDDDAQLEEAVALFDGTELELTPEEQKLVADQQVDGEFVSPFARDRATVGRSVNELNRQLESYDRAATKAYLANRLLSTRELFEMMIEQHPGHVPALCKLGMVQLKLQEPMDAVDSFRRAIELDGNNSYANQMLGYAYYTLEDIPSAELYVKRAVDLAPDNAKNYILLGQIAYRLGEFGDAAANFKAAISVDPVPSEPYYNLAVLSVKEGRLEAARKYYNDALERGALPDAGLESKMEDKS
jgi:tetratricopeptide (TPR) repeat protein